MPGWQDTSGRLPCAPGAGRSGVGWDLGVHWSTYQRPTFVTPAFPGFVSGHSTFSRAAAEVMTGITGSPYFPGGLFEETFAPGALKLEQGPSAPVKLQAATYYDAADQAGISRIYGGIHITADDYAGPARRFEGRKGRLGARPALLRWLRTPLSKSRRDLTEPCGAIRLVAGSARPGIRARSFLDVRTEIGGNIVRKLVITLVIAALTLCVTVTAAVAKPTKQAATADICVLLPDPKSSVRWETQDRPALVAAFKKARRLVRDHERRRQRPEAEDTGRPVPRQRRQGRHPRLARQGLLDRDRGGCEVEEREGDRV